MDRQHAYLDPHRDNLLADIINFDDHSEIGSKYGVTELEISEWFIERFGYGIATFREALATYDTALVYGQFYFVDASREARQKLAQAMQEKFTPEITEPLPKGDYQVWVVEEALCIMSTDRYEDEREIYRKVYPYDLSLNHPAFAGELVAIHDTDCRGVPLPDSTVAFMFNLMWFENHLN